MEIAALDFDIIIKETNDISIYLEFRYKTAEIFTATAKDILSTQNINPIYHRNGKLLFNEITNINYIIIGKYSKNFKRN